MATVFEADRSNGNSRDLARRHGKDGAAGLWSVRGSSSTGGLSSLPLSLPIALIALVEGIEEPLIQHMNADEGFWQFQVEWLV